MQRNARVPHYSSIYVFRDRKSLNGEAEEAEEAHAKKEKKGEGNRKRNGAGAILSRSPGQSSRVQLPPVASFRRC